MIRVLTFMGTRPEAIKLAPVVQALAKRPERFESLLAASGQHDRIFDEVLEIFDLTSHFNLKAMRKDANLSRLTARVLAGAEQVIQEARPHVVLVQGDTTTAMAGALAAFYARIPVAHVEAGLRTWDLDQPFPEEMNRRLIDEISDFLFAPTAQNRENLLRMPGLRGQVHVTGNTVVDALKQIASSSRARLPEDLEPRGRRLVLMTAHRRENLGGPMDGIFQAVSRLVKERDDILVVFPMHPNPRVRTAAMQRLSGLANLKLLPPLDYLSFVALLLHCHLVLTDSGGVQEEAASLQKPVLVLREVTERMEIIKAGAGRLVGSAPEDILRATHELLDDTARHRAMRRAADIYGDGLASARIVDILDQTLAGEALSAPMQEPEPIRMREGMA